jgi:hypothetical protein
MAFQSLLFKISLFFLLKYVKFGVIINKYKSTFFLTHPTMILLSGYFFLFIEYDQ